MTLGVADQLQRYRSGETDAGIALCRAVHPAVRAVALAGTLDRELAEEATRSALGKLLDRLPEVEAADDLLPLADRIANAEVKEIVRREGGRTTELVGISADRAARGRGAMLDLEAVFGDLPPETAGRMLLEATGWIPDQYRTAFLLRYLSGLSWEEIADLSGSTPADVGRTLSAARKLYERELLFHLKKLAAP